MGPFTFNGIRFSLGALSLVPILIWQRRKNPATAGFSLKTYAVPIGLTGAVLFIASSLQQVGLMGSTAGKGGFITGLYVILVPLLALFWGQRTHIAHWTGALLAVFGLYLLSFEGGWTISPYDLVLLAGAFIWAVHVHLIAKYADPVGPVRLACMQFAVCGFLSLAAALFFEPITIAKLRRLMDASVWVIFIRWSGLYTAGHRAANCQPNPCGHHPQPGGRFCRPGRLAVPP